MYWQKLVQHNLLILICIIDKNALRKLNFPLFFNTFKLCNELIIFLNITLNF